MSLVLIVNNVRSAQNVGSIFRSADAFGVDKIILSGISPYPEIQKDARLPHVRQKASSMIAKTALGAEKNIEYAYIPLATEAITQLKTQGYQIIGLEQHEHSVKINELKSSPKVALIVGNEVEGVPDKILRMCDVVAEIPMQGKKESLNVAVAAGIALYELSTL